jgi:hypothetical protein
VSVDDVVAALTANTVLVTVMHSNNEVSLAAQPQAFETLWVEHRGLLAQVAQQPNLLSTMISAMAGLLVGTLVNSQTLHDCVLRTCLPATADVVSQ